MKIGSEDLARTRELVEEVLMTALAVEDVIAALLEDIPENAFPGEDNGVVLLEMVVGSVARAVVGAGERDRRAAIDLVVAIRERVLADLHTAAERSSGREAGSSAVTSEEGR